MQIEFRQLPLNFIWIMTRSFPDGNFETDYNIHKCTHTAMNPGNWWLVDLRGMYVVSNASVTNRKSGAS